MTGTDKESAQLLERAYALKNDDDAKLLYRDWANTYDQTMMDGLKYLTPSKTAELLATSGLDRAANVLDIGAGTGLGAQQLAIHGFFNIDALDYSPEMLATASRKTFNGKQVYQNLIEADLNEPLPLKDQSYDAMLCIGTFTHAHVGAGCLPELFRALKVGGLFACTVHKDVWQKSGFETQVNALQGSGVLRTREMTMDIFFETDEEPQGWFILWEKAK